VPSAPAKPPPGGTCPVTATCFTPNARQER
jgi:hypothetical protein